MWSHEASSSTDGLAQGRIHQAGTPPAHATYGRLLDGDEAPNGPVEIATRVEQATSNGVPEHATWGAEAVGDWLSILGLGQHAGSFIANQVTGDLLENMDKDDLRELGVKLVGHRLLLLKEIAGLRRKAESIERSKLLWQAEEVLDRNGLMGYLKSIITCQRFIRGPDKYTLTGSTLVRHLAPA